MSLPFPWALVLALVSGFVALAYEIVWARFYNFASASRAPAFGAMLGSYLFGLALGALLSHRWQRAPVRGRSGAAGGNPEGDSVGGGARAPGVRLRTLSRLVLVSNMAAFLVVPVASWAILGAGWPRTLPLVMAGAALLGTILPLVCHFAIPADREAGARLSFIYLANIIGAGAGSLLTGFVLMDWLKLWQIQAVLLGFGLVVAAGTALLSGAVQKQDVALWVLAGALAGAAAPLHDGLYERLFYNRNYLQGMRLVHVVESRHGVIMVDADRRVYGNGAYDGVIETKLKPGSLLARPYFVSAIHPHPRQILVIGMSAGAWTQILCHHPQVEKVTVVEISKAYFEIVRAYPQVSGILTNAKVEIIIDDGRRWLRRHPERRFDAVVMNTTWHWREFTSALLSKEFLELVKSHLEPGGVFLWNCTGSDRAARTGMEVFPHTMMVLNNCVGSLTPLVPDKARWRGVLACYRINGQLVFDLATPEGRQDLEGVLGMLDGTGGVPRGIRLQQEMQAAFGGARIITDDNLGQEFYSSFRQFLFAW